MTSLTDVYDGDVGSVVDRRRRRLGTALFLVGAAIVVAAIAMATTGLREVFGLGLYEAREVAGLLAGLGLPGVIVGIFAVLPASRVVRAAAAMGAGFSLLGVSLFAYAYPDRWISVDPALTVAAILLYGLGTLTTVWCMFAALATFKTRNDPGGTARVEITEEGRIRIIEAEEESHSGGGIPGFGGFGSVGLFGSDPDGEVATQTNRTAHAADGGTGVASASDGGTEVFRADDAGSTAGTGGSGTGGRGGSVGCSGAGKPHPNATSDGGAEVLDDSAGAVDAVASHASPDEYCGNCTHFEYVRVEGELVPYCGFHEDLMEDMDACADWTPNS